MLIGSLVKQIRRIVNDPVISGSATRSDLEIPEYIRDVLPEVKQDVPVFGSYVISGNQITPDPDTVDGRLMVLKAAELITLEDWRENAGDAILIQQGSIKLDTSKGTRFFKELYDSIRSDYNKLSTKVNIHGKTSGTISVGSRVDNYISRTTDSKAGDSLL